MKTQLSKTVQSVEILCWLLFLIMKLILVFTKNVLTPLAKGVLMALGLTTAESAPDAVIQKKVFWLGMTTLNVYEHI